MKLGQCLNSEIVGLQVKILNVGLVFQLISDCSTKTIMICQFHLTLSFILSILVEEPFT